MSGRHVVHVMQGVSNPSAGPTYSVGRLARECVLQGEPCEVSALGLPPVEWPLEVPLTLFDDRLVRAIGLSLPQWLALRDVGKANAVLHGHGIWRPANLFPLWLPRQRKARVVISPRGMLSTWSLQHKRWRKLPFWIGFQRPALASADAFHATAESEYEDIRRAGFRQPVAIIPNGVETPELPLVTKRRRLLFLSRIDPKKGLEMLISAWAALAPAFPDWELTIAGPLGDAYSRSVQALASSSRAPRVTFVGQVSGIQKQDLLANSSLFVLPTFSENFGIAIAEALAHGTAVVTTTGTPWGGLRSKGAGWWVEPTVPSVTDALREGMAQPATALWEMGQRGRDWMQAEYGWSRIADQMRGFYNWLFDGGERPDFVFIR